MNLIQYLPARVVSVLLCTLMSLTLLAQGGGGNPAACNTLTVNLSTIDSRCRATGSVTISTSGGSGQFNYRVSGPVSTTYTSSNTITGLVPGTYSVFVNDIVNNCTKETQNVVIGGSYTDIRFSLDPDDITCKNSLTGSLTATGITGGAGQFFFTIIAAPSPADIGRINSTGFFSNLPPGDYAVQMEDSCGGLQTRRASILPYDWWIEGSSGIVTVCSTATFNLALRDSRGKTTPDTAFNGFRYGWVRNPNDTAWSNSPAFTANILNRRSVTLVVKDPCGNTDTAQWSNTVKPAVAAAITTSQSVCNVFTASVTGMTNLNNPIFCLYNSAYDQIACNSTGVFTNLVQDNYSIEIRDLCYDTLIRRNFSLTNPKPDVTASPAVTRTSCNLFNVQMVGLVNFTNPQFCLYKNNVLVTCNITGLFKNLLNGTYEMRITDGCYDTTVIRAIDVQPLKPIVNDVVNISNRTCTTFDVNVTGQANLTLPQYSLWKGATQLAANTTGIFTAVPYGFYCIRIVNSPTCYDTTIVRCFEGAPFLPEVGQSLSLRRDCNTVDVSVNGQQHLTNPQYCLFDLNGAPLGCNTTGVFPDLPYGSYCIKVINDPSCYDTVIQRCVVIQKIPPSVGAVSQSNASCLTFDAKMTGQAGVYNPVYTLKNGAGVVVAVNTTGDFTGLAYGDYCIEMKNDPVCYDTTITRCFTGQKPIPDAGTVQTSALTCPSFTASITGLVNITNPVYTLKDSAGNVISVNTTGVFAGLAYLSYCLEIKNDPLCYDTTLIRCFTAVRPTPSIDSVMIDGYSCANFNATVTGQYLLTNPVYNLKDSSGNIISTNTTGVFTNIPYGYYTIEVIDGCYETPFVRTFNATRQPFQVNASAGAGCYAGTTTISVNLSNGSSPYVVTVYDPTNNVVGNIVSNAGLVKIQDLPALPAGMQYRVEVVDSCGRMGTRLVSPVLFAITRNIQVIQRCPSGLLPNGSSDVIVNVTSNGGNVFPVIIRRDGVTVNIGHSNQLGRTFTFRNLAPATYVIRYDLPGGCANKLYDTVLVNPYTYPVIAQAAVFQCSNNSFTVSCQIQGGAPAYQYQIIGSTPAIPSINTGWQSSPVFTINNGASYSLVRLRAIDACGNAALNDAFVLPLQNLIVASSSSCLFAPTTLSVDVVANASYTWYKMTGTDSTVVGTGPSYNIVSVTPSDTGVYKVRMTVNNGCLERVATFDLTGICQLLTVADIRLSGERSGNAANLTWKVKGEKSVKQYIIEFSTDQNSGFRPIGSLNPASPQGDHNYNFAHGAPVTGNNYYRIKVVDINGKASYSNTISLAWTGRSILIYPVPAKQVVYVSVNNKQGQDLRIQLYTLSGQLLQEKVQQRVVQAQIPIYRQNYAAGVYLLRITDMSTGATQTEKIIFE